MGKFDHCCDIHPTLSNDSVSKIEEDETQEEFVRKYESVNE